MKITNAAAIAACDAIVDRCDLGSGHPNARLRIYDGTVPTNADDALGAQVLLAELEMSNPAFGAAVDINPGARATAGTITDDTAADADGTATFARVIDRSGTPVLQYTVGTSGTDIVMNSVTIRQNARVEISALTFTHPE